MDGSNVGRRPWPYVVFAFLAIVGAVVGCASPGASAPEPAAVSNRPGEEGLEVRITELVGAEIRRQKLNAELVASETPYLRYRLADSKVMVGIVEGAVTKACREYGGALDDRGNTRSFVLSAAHFGAKRADAKIWPTASGKQDTESRLSLLMDTASEAGSHESASHLESVCLLPGHREAVLAAYEDRPGQSVFDRVRPDAARFYAQPDLRRYYWLSVGSFDRYAARVPAIRADYLQRVVAIRDSIRPQSEAIAEADRAEARAEQQRSDAALSARQAIASAAADRFRSAAAFKKEIGLIVCSSDNRLAYVEQIAGVRVKLTVRGQAAGTFEEFGRYGPRSLKSRTGQYLRHDEAGLIEYPNFLFQPLSSAVRFTSAPETIWDLSERWGVCEFR